MTLGTTRVRLYNGDILTNKKESTMNTSKIRKFIIIVSIVVMSGVLSACKSGGIDDLGGGITSANVQQTICEAAGGHHNAQGNCIK